MYIKVEDEDNKIMFKGDADDFILNNNYDDEIIERLNVLNNLKVGASILLYSSEGERYKAKRISYMDAEFNISC